MSHTPTRFVATAALVLLATAAQAQINSPPPTLQGQPSSHVFTVPGVINDGMGTVFACTNVSSDSVIVGVEVFDPTGTLINDASASSATVPAGGTVMFATRAMGGFGVDANLGIGLMYKGSARILATSKKGIVCSAFVADPVSYPTGSMASLTIVAKTKQKGD